MPEEWGLRWWCHDDHGHSQVFYQEAELKWEERTASGAKEVGHLSETNHEVSSALDEFRQAGSPSTLPCQCLSHISAFFHLFIVSKHILHCWGLVSVFFCTSLSFSSLSSFAFHLCPTAIFLFCHPLYLLAHCPCLPVSVFSAVIKIFVLNSQFSDSEPAATKNGVEWVRLRWGGGGWCLWHGGRAKDPRATEQHVISLKCSLYFRFIINLNL